MRRQLYILVLLIIAMLLLSFNFISPNQVLLGSSTVSAASRSLAPVNLALNKLATQSTTETDNEACRAVDGNINGDISADSVSTTLSQVRPWWEVDLGAVCFIDTVEIYKRTGCCFNEVSQHFVLVSDVPFVSPDFDTTRNQLEVTSKFGSVPGEGEPGIFTLGRAGRYVRVQLSGDSEKALNLAEVQVLGKPIPTALAMAGQWSRIPDLPDKPDLPDIPVHISLLPSGKLLFWGRDKRDDGYDEDGKSNIHLWDPISNTFTRKDHCKTNLFCSGHSFLPNGDLFVAGGSETPTDTARKRYDVEGHGPRETYIFDYVNEVWLPGPTMTHGRWYPSLITLSTGETLIVTGDYVDRFTQRTGRPDSPVHLKNQDTEILRLDRTLPRMPNDMLGPLTNYPWFRCKFQKEGERLLQ
jgi:hypothetical protein